MDTFYHTNIINVPRIEDPLKTYPHVMARPSANGSRVFKVLEQHRKTQDRGSLQFPARRLIANGGREVLGARFENGGQRKSVAVKARCGVLLACGGLRPMTP